MNGIRFPRDVFIETEWYVELVMSRFVISYHIVTTNRSCNETWSLTQHTQHTLLSEQYITQTSAKKQQRTSNCCKQPSIILYSSNLWNSVNVFSLTLAINRDQIWNISRVDHIVISTKTRCCGESYFKLSTYSWLASLRGCVNPKKSYCHDTYNNFAVRPSGRQVDGTKCSSNSKSCCPDGNYC